MHYEVVRERRYFDRDRRYSEINWVNLAAVVEAFEKRISNWYIEPARKLAENGHFAFTVMAINCLIIDMLSQYTVGADESSRKQTFKDFVRENGCRRHMRLGLLLRLTIGTEQMKNNWRIWPMCCIQAFVAAFFTKLK